MVTISGSVVDFIAKNEETLGEPWVRSIEPPFHEDSVHALSLADDADPADVLKRAQQSFGHRCAKSRSITQLPGAAINQAEWGTQHEPDFRKWNVDLAEGAARLRTLNMDSVCAILCVARRGFTGSPFITILGAPVITQISPEDPNSYGAPDWSRTVSGDIASLYTSTTDTRTHSVVASAASFSRAEVPTDQQHLDSLTCPVISTSIDQFSTKVDSDDESEGQYKVLFLPNY